MPVTSFHPLYDDVAPDWKKCRDVHKGSRAVKAAQEAYLPNFSGKEGQRKQAKYAAYLLRALFYGATDRTIEGFKGAIFRKPPTLAIPKGMEPWLEDVTATGTPLALFAQELMSEILITGRYGVLVDIPEEETPIPRPRLAGYRAEEVTNWRTAMIAGESRITLVVLKEEVEEEKDSFSQEKIIQYRVLRLDEEGFYLQEIWREIKEGQTGARWEIWKILTPNIRGERMDFIPFTFFAPSGLDVCPAKPPLLDLVEVNLSHYRSSADYEHGLHYTALPTAWVAGFPEDAELEIGSANAWITSEPTARAGFLEFSGQGLKPLAEALDKKERLMAILGARLLEESKRDAEAAETVRLRQAGESSILSTLAWTESLGLTQCLRWVAMFLGKEGGEISVELNQDFFESKLSPQELVARVEAWQKGAVSWETLFWQLEQGELIPPGVDAQKERALIDAEIESRRKKAAEESMKASQGEKEEGNREEEGEEEREGAA